MSPKILTLLDLNNNHENRAVGEITAIAEHRGFKVRIFDVRYKNELPDLKDCKNVVSTGGPGDPNELGPWADGLFEIYKGIVANNKSHRDNPKRLFAICHSFQEICGPGALNIGKAILRNNKQTLFGVHPQIIQNLDDVTVPAIKNLPPELLTLESRDYQVVQTREHPDFIVFAKRCYNDCDAITGIVSRDGNIIGTQWHPEAAPQSAQQVLRNPKAHEFIENHYGLGSWQKMLDNVPQLDTSHGIFRSFLDYAFTA